MLKKKKSTIPPYRFDILQYSMDSVNTAHKQNNHENWYVVQLAS